MSQHEVIGQALRGEVTMYPPIAIRELVANALIHQDFAVTGTGVKEGSFARAMSREAATPMPAAVAAARTVRRLRTGLGSSSMVMLKIRNRAADVAPQEGGKACLYGLLADVDDRAPGLLTRQRPRSKVTGPPALTLR